MLGHELTAYRPICTYTDTSWTQGEDATSPLTKSLLKRPYDDLIGLFTGLFTVFTGLTCITFNINLEFCLHYTFLASVVYDFSQHHEKEKLFNGAQRRCSVCPLAFPVGPSCSDLHLESLRWSVLTSK